MLKEYATQCRTSSPIKEGDEKPNKERGDILGESRCQSSPQIYEARRQGCFAGDAGGTV